VKGQTVGIVLSVTYRYGEWKTTGNSYMFRVTKPQELCWRVTLVLQLVALSTMTHDCGSAESVRCSSR
jgi:hypothetical protein